MKTIELTYSEIAKIARIAEQHGSEVIEVYLFGDRDKGEKLNIWDKGCNRWTECYTYPWCLEDVDWAEFTIGETKND